VNTKMPRGGIPSGRSELAASDPYRPGSSPEVFVPSQFPAPNHELAAAAVYRPSGPTPESHLAWPTEIGAWEDDNLNSSMWAEEAFAKACTEPKVALPADVVRSAAQECGSSNFARFMRTSGFRMNDKVYLDGSFYAFDWTDSAMLRNAIANAGPVKIGFASTAMFSSPHGHVAPGSNGWAMYGLSTGGSEDLCGSLCGYGSLAELAALLEKHGVNVALPPGMPRGLSYAMFVRGSIGIIDDKSLMTVIGEAWVRHPTTICKSLIE
jgi:hypothetical protein